MAVCSSMISIGTILVCLGIFVVGKLAVKVVRSK